MVGSHPPSRSALRRPLSPPYELDSGFAPSARPGMTMAGRLGRMQKGTAKTFLLVHGAWHGGWAWRRVADRLRARGHIVFAPTLTGLGERAHLLRPGIDLSLHIADVLGVIRY